MPNRHQNHERGATAMLVVIFLALLLSIVTISFVRLSINERRQSTDDDLTRRAFYAAESGLEDAKRALAQYLASQPRDPLLLNGDDCAAPAILNPNADGIVELSPTNGLDAAYVCQLIKIDPTNFQTQLAAWESVTIPLKTGGLDYDSIIIEWHQPGPSPFNGDITANPNSPQLFPADAWNGAEYAAMLRTGLFSTPDSGPLNRANIFHIAGFLYPGTSGTTVDINPIQQFNHKVVPSTCDDTVADGQYACSMTIIDVTGNFNPGDRINYLRLMALYRATNVQVTLLDGGGVPVPLEEVQALVDATGRSGQIFRRLSARISLIDGDDFPFPDYALITADSICKNFFVNADTDDFDDLNPFIKGACVGHNPEDESP